MTDDPSRFGTFEEQPDYFIKFLDERTTQDDEHAVKELISTLLAPTAGTAILDVGCGTGIDAIALARSVGSRGRVVGVDRNPDMVAEAARRAAGSGLPVEFAQGDALALTFADDSFDRCRAERILVHVTDPAKAVREMVRVTRPGGTVVVSDIDGGTMFLSSSNAALTKSALLGLADDMASGRVGRHLQRYFVEAGLSDVRCVPRVLRNSVSFLQMLVGARLQGMVDAGAATADEVAALWAELTEGERAGWLCAGVVCFTVSGTKAG